MKSAANPGSLSERQKAVLVDLAPRLGSLLEAHQAANDLGLPPWEFAVELAALHETGLTNTDVRRLGELGVLLHRYERSARKAGRRVFQSAPALRFSEQSVFLLGDGAAAFLLSLPNQGQHSTLSTPATAERTTPTPPTKSRECPTWNGETGELWFRGQLLVHFDRPAPILRRVLQAFQDAGWPSHLKNPIEADSSSRSAKRRLHGIINRLKAAIKVKLLDFHGDGTGERIWWEPVGKTRTK